VSWPPTRVLTDLAAAVASVGLILIGLTILTLSREEALGTGTGRAGTATVETCQRYGPVSGSGLGLWWRCEVAVQWSDGAADRHRESGSLFTPDEAGEPIAVREVLRAEGRGNLNAAARLVRPDRPANVGALAVGVVVFLAGGLCALRPLADLVRLGGRLTRRRSPPP
jgi:hypothetical protein